jgi:hypothetical protein
MILYMDLAEPAWLLLIVSLPTSSATARMRIWRALKVLGCVALRDGAYLLPALPGHEQALQQRADECSSEGGSAWVMALQARSADESASYRQLFDRSADYAELRSVWQAANQGLNRLAAAELVRLQRKLQRELDAVRAIDFFPGDARAEAEAAWTDLDQRIGSLISPDEPHETQRKIPRLDPAGSTRAAPGRHGGACGSTGWPAPG